MKNFALLLLVATSALGQTSETTRVSKGDLLKQRQYRTTGTATGALTFYVDPTGNDANQCTSTGTAACLTIQGAVNKVPKLLQDLITINVAAGSYAGFIVSGFTMNPAVQKTGGIFINGTLATVTPATGPGTGTATAGTAGTNTTYGTLTDSTQTWTVNDLRGKWVTITGGTGSGQIKVITSNTATAITIAGTWTAPTGTSTYAIQSPASLITSAAPVVVDTAGGTLISAGGFQIANNTMGVSGSTPTSILVQNLAVNSSGGRVLGGSFVAFSQVLMSSGTFSFSDGTNVALTSCSVTTTSTFINSGRSTITASFVAAQTTFSGPIGSVSSTQFTNTAANGIATINTSGNTVVTITSVRCDCGSGATSTCLSTANIAPASGTRKGGSFDVVTGLDVTNCTNGVFPVNGGQVTFATGTTFTGNALTYAVNAVNGGMAFLPAAPTITAGTAELAIDNGALTDTFASLTAIYSCLASLSTSSSICRL